LFCWHFSARFDCANRTYKYFFPRGNLSLARMAAAGERLCGVHDFRNFCKMDVNNGVVNYQRRIFRLSVSVLSKENSPSSPPGKQSFLRMD
jgi:tRNA pseudouridine38/39 synthase